MLARPSQNRALKGRTVQINEGNEQPDGETPSCPEDDLASDAEIQQAIRALYCDVSMKKKMVAVAAMILQRKQHLKREYEPEDLFQESLERIGMQKRSWPKNRVNFAGLVIGVMKSWASSLEKTKSMENTVLVMEHEFVLDNPDRDSLNLEEVATDLKTPLENLEVRELNGEEECLLAILRAQYSSQVLEGRILDAIFKQSFETHEEIIRELGVRTTDYRNAWKVLLRAAKKLGPKE